MNSIHNTLNTFSREISTFFDDHFKEFGLATSYVELILLVKKSGDNCTQKEIAQKMNLDPSTITRFITKLQKKGLVEKSRNGRLVSIQLTTKGEKLSVKAEKAYKKAEDELEEKLGKPFLDTTEKLLKHGVSELET
ncbi:MAG: MarR family transcriptional regulator [Balneolaceae bacterium]